MLQAGVGWALTWLRDGGGGQRMLVAVPSATEGCSQPTHPPLPTHPALRLPRLWACCRLPTLQWGMNFAKGGAHCAPGPTGTARGSFPSPSSKARALPTAQEGAEPWEAETCLKARAGATTEFRELPAPWSAQPMAEGASSPWLRSLPAPRSTGMPGHELQGAAPVRRQSGSQILA